MDDCLTESLVYTDSENSEEEAKKRSKPPVNTYTHSFSSDEDELVDQFPTKDLMENPNEDLNESDDDNFVASKKVRKPKTILSSDDENSRPDSNPDKAEKKESASEKGSTKSDSDHNESNKTSKLKSIIRPSICDSESSSGDDAPEKEDLSKKKKMIKKFRKFKEKPKKEKSKKEKLKKDKSKKEKKPNIKKIASDQSGSESDDDKLPKKSSKSAGNNNSESSGSDSGSSEEQDENAPVQPREKTVQRVSVLTI